MDEAKTRIWHSQDLGLAPALTPSVPPPPPQPLAARKPPPPPPRAGRASTPPPPPRPGLLAATRIMPIERLFPGAVSQRTPHSPTLITAPRSRFRTLKRIGVHLLLGSLTVVAIAAWKLPRAPARARLMPLQPVALEAPIGKATARADGEQETPAPEPPRSTSGARHKEPLERRAIELVIAGDYVGAEQAYRALARDRADSAAFPEAARILAARALGANATRSE